jgi:choline dehydrogenase-like flavoprotein
MTPPENLMTAFASRSTRRPIHYDAVIIGSGVGGSMAAHALVSAGLKVLMIERGVRVRRSPDNWASDAVFELSPYYSMESHYVVRGDERGRTGTLQCVGGPAVFYGAVSYRMRETDFGHCPEIVGDSGARWPFGYDEIEPYYGWAERLLHVAGRGGSDPTEPRRQDPFPRRAPDVQGPARLIWDTASSLGLTPSHLPLAIDFEGPSGNGGGCELCGTCDGYACAISAKRDPGAAILPALERRGLTLVSNTVVVRLLRRGGRVEGVECVDRATGRRQVFQGERYILAAGALGSPHLILASGLQTSSPAREWVGRGLMRHCNGIVFGLFPRRLEGSRAFHKQVGIMDLYGGREGEPRLGCIQSIHPPPPGLVQDRAPGPLGRIAEPMADRSTGLLVIAEDQARRKNGVTLSRSETGQYGMPRAIVTHRYTGRDLEARRVLVRVARGILRRAGASITKSVRLTTFSHAVGTLRMGVDPRTSPLDGTSRFRGVENLWVTDGSFMPRSAAVNPSLTIAANALMAAEHVAGTSILPTGATSRVGRSMPLGVVGGIR